MIYLNNCISLMKKITIKKYLSLIKDPVYIFKYAHTHVYTHTMVFSNLKQFVSLNISRGKNDSVVLNAYGEPG